MSKYNKHRKGKKRKNKRRTIPVGGPTQTNIHHLLWIRACWKGEWTRKLREHPYCKMEIPARTLHKYIHECMSCIPVPREISCKSAYEQIDFLYQLGITKEDSLVRRLNLLAALFDCAEQPTADALREQAAIVQRWIDAQK